MLHAMVDTTSIPTPGFSRQVISDQNGAILLIAIDVASCTIDLYTHLHVHCQPSYVYYLWFQFSSVVNRNYVMLDKKSNKKKMST